MKVVSWNLEGRLSDYSTDGRGTPEKLVAAIREFDADVLVHPEAFGTDPAVRTDIEQSLKELGYKSVSVTYDDAESRGDKAAVINPHLRVMSRLDIVRTEIIRPGDIRNMLSVTVYDPESGSEVRIVGVHLDDRSESLRQRQVAPLSEYINSSNVPTIMMGDFNAMPPRTLKSRFVNGPVFRSLSHLAPHKHMRYTLARLREMASGRTIAAIQSKTKLQNADPKLRATTTPKMRRMEWMPSIRFAKIDWLFTSPDIRVENYRVSRDLGSDHRALSADITLKKP